MFGGHHWVPDRFYQDHWEFDGTTWTERSLAVTPPARRDAGMCFDERRGVVVLFGGVHDPLFGPRTYFGDTWEFDGVAWRQVFPVGPTPAARGAEISYDSVRGVVVLFGGYGSAPLRDTWEYDGIRWVERSSATTPPVRTDYVVAFDRARAKTVMHSTDSFAMPSRGETWEWDGQNWERVNVTLPPPFSEPAMAYDERRQCVVISGATYWGDHETWEYEGAGWRKNPRAFSTMSGIGGHALAYDTRRGSMVLFAGEQMGLLTIVATNQTWEYGTLAGYVGFGQGCAASGPAPRLWAESGGLPATGSALVAEVSGLGSGSVPIMMVGHSRTSLGSQSLPMALGAVGLPGCQLLTSSDFAIPLVRQGGSASWVLPIPLEPETHGSVFYNQVLVLSDSFEIEAVSNGATAEIGL